MTQTAIHGIDVSQWQGDINWARVAAALEPPNNNALIRLTYSTTITDTMAEVNWTKAVKYGFRVGGYHFAVPGTEYPSEVQALRFLTELGSLEKTGKPFWGTWLDLEVNPDGLSPYFLAKWARAWLEKVSTATGRTPGWYSNPNFIRTQLGEEAHWLKPYPLWLACYANQPELPTGFDAIFAWQHSDSGRIPGIKGNVDLDEFFQTPGANQVPGPSYAVRVKGHNVPSRDIEGAVWTPIRATMDALGLLADLHVDEQAKTISVV